jgi:hypothetical protein
LIVVLGEEATSLAATEAEMLNTDFPPSPENPVIMKKQGSICETARTLAQPQKECRPSTCKMAFQIELLLQ